MNRLFKSLVLFSAMAASSSWADTSTTTTSSPSGVESTPAAGGFYLEPLLFGTRQDTSIKTDQLPLIGGNTSGKADGYGLGLKLGLHASERILLGLDARYAKVKMTDSFYQDADSEIYNVGPALGLQTPYWGLRLLGTYIVAGESNPTAGVRGLDLKFKDARGFRYGLGFHIAALSFNLEYEDLTYNKTDIQSFGPLSGSGSTNVDSASHATVFSLSFPVEI